MNKTIRFACNKETRIKLVSNMELRRYKIDFNENETCPDNCYYLEGLLFSVDNTSPLLFGFMNRDMLAHLFRNIVIKK